MNAAPKSRWASPSEPSNFPMPISKPGLPDDVRRFVLTSVPSVPYAEAMLLMRKKPDMGWDAQRLARRLYVSEAQAFDLLRRLSDAGLVRRIDEDGSEYAYAPATPELAARVDAFAESYRHQLMAVTDLIHSPVERRAHQFADAFRWKKDQ